MTDTEYQFTRPDEGSSPPAGYFKRPDEARALSGVERTAFAISVVWLLAAAGYFLIWGRAADPAGMAALRFLLTLLVVFLPVAMIWVAATAIRTARVMQEETARLEAAVDALRRAYVAQNRAAEAEPQIARKLDEIARAQKKTESALAIFSTTRQPDPAPVLAPAPAPAAPVADEGQQPLPLGTDAAPGDPLSAADYIRALNFPETAEDKAGFAALRRALQDRQAAQVIQAAQDVLTLLSQDGIYMDDLRPDRARPELWRRFAAGERGRTIAALGGVRDRSSLALAAGRMRQDTIFRDAAHHFLRVFDRSFASFAQTASDTDIAALTDTRTARAFMLLGRVAGTFD